jgi:fido (protein-threonine AMPylation protein)
MEEGHDKDNQATPQQQDRQSRTVKRERFRTLSEPEKARQEALNTLRQYDRMVEIINETLRQPQRFRLRPSAIQELNRISIKDLEIEAGRWRDVPVVIDGSQHQPPPWEEVPKHVDDLCDYVNDKWNDCSPFHLAAYVMWRLNWIHPFVDGNGRTTRAVSYYVLCAKLGFHMPGVTTVPEMIAGDKAPYYRALEAADAAGKNGAVDVSEMEHLLSELLARQMVLALERAEAPNTHSPVERAKRQIDIERNDKPTRRSTEALRASWVPKAGMGFAAVALLFFMVLVVMSIWGHVVPGEAHYLVVIVLAFSGALSAGFLGGNASARGVIPIPFVNQSPLSVAFSGGIAVFVALLLLGHHLFM